MLVMVVDDAGGGSIRWCASSADGEEERGRGKERRKERVQRREEGEERSVVCFVGGEDGRRWLDFGGGAKFRRRVWLLAGAAVDRGFG